MDLKDPRTCRIFFSSPFGGMEGEREELTSRYFPQLHHLCNSKGIQFVAVDMRWGITTEAAKQAQVIKICLQELDRSDLFVGFFGQRYGWFGKEDELLQKTFDEAVSQYPFLEKWRDKSVTELEFLHGHLNEPGKMPAVICFRDKVFDDVRREEGISTGSKSLVYKYSAEEGSKSFMDDLKSRVKDTEAQTLGVEMAYKTPKEGAKFMFDAVWKYLNETMLKDVTSEQKTWREIQLAQHTAILRNRSGLYVGGEEYLAKLNQSLESSSVKPLLVRGAKGSGKSSLLSTWIHSLQENQRELIIVYHFVGFAEDSTGIPNILKRLYLEIEHQLENQVDSAEETVNKTDIIDIIQHWTRKSQQSMEKVFASGRKAVIVIDGLNMVDSTGKVGKHLFWLSDSIPEGVHLIVSSLSSDEKTNLQLVENKGFAILELLPLSPQHQEELCSKTLKASGKELDEAQLKRVVDAKLTHNPLFLKICMDELCVFGYFRDLDKKIDSLVNSHSVEDLFTQYLNRLEKDYNVKDYEGNLVEKVMCCLALSHNGVSENELIEIFSIPNYLWSPLYFTLNKYLVDRSGLLGFAFDELRVAVETRYLNDKTVKNKYCGAMIKYFSKQLKTTRPLSSDGDPARTRPCHELPRLYLKMADRKGLAQILSNLVVFEAIYKADAYQLLDLWKETMLNSKEIAQKCIHSYNYLLAEDYCDSMEEWRDHDPSVRMRLLGLLDKVQELLDLAKMLEGQEMILLRSKEILENLEGKMDETKRQTEINSLNYTLACLYCDTERLEESAVVHYSILEYRKRCLDLDGHKPTLQEYRNLGVSYHGIAAVKLAQGLWDEAEEMFLKSMEFHKLVEQDKGEKDADCLMNLGNVYMLGRQEYPKALEYYTEAFKKYEETFFGRLPLNMGNLLTNIALCHRKMNNLEEAENYYKRSLDIKVNAVGDEHPSTALAYTNLSTLESIRENYTKSEEYARKSLNIYLVNDVPDHLREVIMARENLATNLATRQNRQEESLEFYWPAFEALTKKGEMNKCLPLLHVEIARYCLEKGRLDDGERITLAMLGCPEKHADRNFIHLHYIDSQKPEGSRPKRPEEYSLKHALTIWPFSKGLVDYTAKLQMLPEADLEGFLKMIENYHTSTEGKEGEEFFKEAAKWCGESGKEQFMMDVFHLGLKFYPNSKILLTNIVMKMREENDPVSAVPYAKRLYDSSMDECRFQMYAVESVIMAANFDLGRKYLGEIKERWKDEPGLIQKVENILGVIDTAEEEMSKDKD